MNNRQLKLTAFFGATLCLIAVVIGAFGAHAFNELLMANERKDVFDLANRYQFYHGLALILIASLFAREQVENRIALISSLMFLGTIVFCTSLYLLALLNLTWLGAVAPIGGVLLIISWGLLVIEFFEFKQQ
jgi:uncharacterized membrane protein YgdD (TMEM256/DUF423 family)